MLVLNDRPGQLCNRIWSFAPYVAFAKANKVGLVIPFFGEFKSEFPDVGRIPGVYVLRGSGPLYLRIVRRLFRVLKTLPRSLRQILRIRVDDRNWGRERWDDPTLRTRRSLVFLSGWQHPSPLDDLRPWRAILRRMLRPSGSICTKVEALVSDVRESSEKLVGVHLRRGDYREWAGGLYFYSNADYVKLMQRIAAQVTGSVTFLLCSNEPVDLAEFTNLTIVALPESTGLEDLHALSRCDLIVGPPSTFSMWASFYGDVPLYFIEDAQADVRLDAFSPIIALNRFADGRTFQLSEQAEALIGNWFTAE